LNLLKKAVFVIDKINEWAGRLCKWLIIPLTVTVVLEVVMRYVFNRPTIWSFELSTFFGGAFFMLIVGAVTLSKRHVVIDIFSAKMSRKTRAVLDIITYMLLYNLLSGVLFWYGAAYAINSWKQHELSWSVWQPPLYPIKTVIPVAAFLMLIQGIAVVIRRVIFLVNGEEV
jgi:TRAP-type mannitol/chloroaromatic compound transport system permease small subunit